MSNFQYENHYELKKNRLEAFDAADNRCVKCGGVATVAHHRDKSVCNHDVENLMVLCNFCHKKEHEKGPRWDTSAIEVAMMQAGVDRAEIAEALGMTYNAIAAIVTTGRTKNKTMKKIADLLGCPIEALIHPKYSDDLDKLNEKGGMVNPLKIAVYERLKHFPENSAVHRLHHIRLTNAIRKKYKVNSYFLVPKEHQQEAIRFIENYKFE